MTGDILPLAGAVMMSAIFLISGLGKLAAPGQTIGYIASVGLPFATLGYVVAVLMEVGGGIALIVGYRARLAALVLAVFSLAAALAFHNDLADQNQLVHFLKNVAMAGGLLQIVAYGRGRLSLDARRR
jgi:putative oxidoreductase